VLARRSSGAETLLPHMHPWQVINALITEDGARDLPSAERVLAMEFFKSGSSLVGPGRSSSGGSGGGGEPSMKTSSRVSEVT
jgi:hypothetical protein